MIFNFKIEKLVILLIPSFLRKTRMVGWIRTLSAPISQLYYDFIQKRYLDIKKLGLNGQVCYLRKALNDAFDIEQRRIRIWDGNQYKGQYLYTEGEQKPKFLGTMYLHREVDYSDTGVDFIVKIPLEIWEAKKISTSEIGKYRFFEIEALIDFYKLASKRYIIEV
nr:hypothetical protein [uncultured Capnocytophaga sp.]